MRRKDREVTDSNTINEIILNCSCCRLGLPDNYKIYIIPLNFGYVFDNEKRIFYFHSASEGRKLDLIKNNDYAAFELDTNHKLVPGSSAHHCSFEYQSVIGEGKISVVDDKKEKILGLNKIMEHYTGQSQNEFAPEVVKRTVVFKLEVTEISAKMH